MSALVEEIESFVNALQLSIRTPIQRWSVKNDSITLFFTTHFADFKFVQFKKLITVLKEDHRSLQFPIPSSKEMSLLTTFLMLTRLQEKNIQKLSEMDERFASFAEKLGFLAAKITSVSTTREAAQIIFKTVGEKKMTIRELSEKSGLTQVAISNFKRGGDIRLSSLLKLSDALKLRVVIKP